MPRTPSRPNSRASSRAGSVPSSNHRATYGRTCSSTMARTEARTSFSSWVNRPSRASRSSGATASLMKACCHCPRQAEPSLRPVATDRHPTSLHARGLQRPDHLGHRVVRHLHQGEPVGDLDGADVTAGEPRLTGDRTHEVLRTHPAGPAETHEQPRPARGGSPSARSAVALAPASAGLAVRPRLPVLARGRRLGGLVLLVDRAAGGLVRQLDRGERDLHDVEVVGERLDDDPELVELVLQQALVQGCAGELQPPGAQVRRAGDLLDRDTLSGHPLDRLQHPVLAGLGQRDRHPLAAAAPDPADPVDVGLRRRGHLVVDDVRELLDVEPTGGDVRGHEQGRGAAAEPSHHAIALLLAHPTVQRLGAVAAPVQRLGELVDLLAGAAEHDRRSGRLDVQHPAQGGRLVRPRDDVRRLPDQRSLAGSGRLALDPHPDRLAQVAAGDAVDSGRHGRREQHGLPAVGGLRQDPLEVLGEAHVQHLVGLVEHDDLDRAEPQGAAREVVQCPSGSRHDDVDAALQLAQLAADRLTAVDGQHPGAEVAAVLVHRLRHLHAELTRGDQHQSRGIVPARPRWRALQHRESERGRLAGAGCCLPQHVLSCQQVRDRLALDRRGLLVAEGGQGSQELFAQAQVGEGGGVFGRGHGTIVPPRHGRMSMRTWLTERLGLELPLVSAPMAGPAGGRLAGAGSAAGALGMIGVAPAATSAWIAEQVELARAAAGARPFGLGLLAWALDEHPDHLDAALGSGAALVSVSYGNYARCVPRLKDAGILVATQVGTLGEARAAVEAGVDVIVARGGEGGGHGRGDVGTLPLLQLVLDAVDLPVLAAGGLAGPRGLAAVLAAGAAGGWVGTAFLTCPEAETSAVARARLLAADDTATAYGRVFDVGQRLPWPPEYGGRALRNTFFDRWQGREAELAEDDEAYQSLLAARASQDVDIAPVYAGEGAALLTGEPSAAEVVRSFAAAADLLRRAAGQ